MEEPVKTESSAVPVPPFPQPLILIPPPLPSSSLSVDTAAIIAALNQITAALTSVDARLASLVELTRRAPAQLETRLCHTAALPTALIKPSVALDDLRDLFARASKAGHRNSLAACLELQGAKKLPDLPLSEYEGVAKYVRGLLNETV